MKFGVGQPVKRVEDVRLVSGQGAFASDYAPEGALHATFLRSPHAHAKFAVTDSAGARALPGVHGVFVASDFSALGELPCLAKVPNSDGSMTPAKPYPVMANEEAHHVGDIVAMAVADTLWQARDALEALVVDWEALPAAVDVEAAIQSGAARGLPGRAREYRLRRADRRQGANRRDLREGRPCGAGQGHEPAGGRKLHGAARGDRRIRRRLRSLDPAPRKPGRPPCPEHHRRHSKSARGEVARRD